MGRFARNPSTAIWAKYHRLADLDLAAAAIVVLVIDSAAHLANDFFHSASDCDFTRKIQTKPDIVPSTSQPNVM